MSNLPAPKDTRDVFIKYFNQAKNPGLLFDRFTDAYLGNWTLDIKKTCFEMIQKIPYDADFLSYLKLRQESLFKVMKAKYFFAQPDWRFISGLGSQHPLEVGFTFHRIYGIPIIAGSSLKGLARAYADFGLKVAKDELDVVFGNQDKAGSAIFFDALPVDPPKLELDVMNPHYPDWYQSQEPPSNWQSPNPIFFLTVGKDTEFRFAVGERGKDGQIARDKAYYWLKEALREMGVGAKTSAGYGYFSKSIDEEKKKEQAPQIVRQTAYKNFDTEPKAKVELSEDGTWKVVLPKLPDQHFKLKPKPLYSKAAIGAKIRVRIFLDKNGNIQRTEEI